jgi:hypothetical protein
MTALLHFQAFRHNILRDVTVQDVSHKENIYVFINYMLCRKQAKKNTDTAQNVKTEIMYLILHRICTDVHCAEIHTSLKCLTLNF